LKQLPNSSHLLVKKRCFFSARMTLIPEISVYKTMVFKSDFVARLRENTEQNVAPKLVRQLTCDSRVDKLVRQLSTQVYPTLILNGMFRYQFPVKLCSGNLKGISRHGTTTALPLVEIRYKFVLVRDAPETVIAGYPAGRISG
jgi:hypothetical protein